MSIYDFIKIHLLFSTIHHLFGTDFRKNEVYLQLISIKPMRMIDTDII